MPEHPLVNFPPTSCIGVTASHRALHCLSLAKDSSDDIREHTRVLLALAWETPPTTRALGIPHPEMLEMSDEGCARRKEIREERRMVNALRGRVAGLLRDAQMYLVRAEEDAHAETDADEALDPMSRRIRDGVAKGHRTRAEREVSEIEASVRDAEEVPNAEDRYGE